jgi:hypothetical protein
MKTLFILVIAFFLSNNTHAQTITGDWNGALNIQGSTIHLVFHIFKTATAFSTTMDSPDQGAKGLATDKTLIKDQQIVIEALKFGIEYKGIYDPNTNKIDGTFKQGTASFPLILIKTPAIGDLPKKNK